jgi:23S rRNA (guanosine2251-2'-O)-methyltransferase
VIIYGRNPLREALRGRRRASVSAIWATSAASHESWLADLQPKIATAQQIARRCGSEDHQGVCAEAGGYPYISCDELLNDAGQLLLALDQVQDPHNLGSICRTAECAGVAGVLIPERRSAEITPAVCKASAGAVEHMRIARVRNLADSLVQARKAGYWCYGASAWGQAVDYLVPDYGGGVVLVLGSEGSGLRPRVASTCDQLVKLPMSGRIESLGVSAAAAVLMYGILHSRQAALDNSP